MSWRSYILLSVFGLIVAAFVSAFQSTPGYMDADAYYIGGRELALGHGFREPYIWNYLDNPAGIPHPSNAYWMPMASLLAAGGAWLLGPNSWTAARVGFLIIAGTLPALTAALAYSLSSRKELAFTSGLLAVFPAFYLPFLTVTDTFGIYMLLGGLFFIFLFNLSQAVSRKALLIPAFLLGVISGLMHLARADGILWLFIALAADLFILPMLPRKQPLFKLSTALLTLAGYLLIMGPWFARNVSVFGTPLSPSSTKMFWLTYYDQLFSFPASILTFSSWWQSGLAAILKVRAWSLGMNLATALSVQGEIFLLPLIIFGFWHLRKDRRLLLAGVTWLLTLGAMTLIFPFAGARGGFFHSGASLQIVWWALAPIGLERMIEWGKRRRGWNPIQGWRVFQMALIILAVTLTGTIVWNRVIGSKKTKVWDQENLAYSRISQYLVSEGATDKDVVIVANPPGFYLESGNPSIAVPDGNIHTLLTVAANYNARLLVLEAGSVPGGLQTVYDNPQGQQDLIYLGEIERARIFLIRRH